MAGKTINNEMYIINFHGNSKKKEICPDGSKDENVFDIQQGVSINLFIKTSNKKDGDIVLAELFEVGRFLPGSPVRYQKLPRLQREQIQVVMQHMALPPYPAFYILSPVNYVHVSFLKPFWFLYGKPGPPADIPAQAIAEGWRCSPSASILPRHLFTLPLKGVLPRLSP
jgi:hypothetical protein